MLPGATSPVKGMPWLSWRMLAHRATNYEARDVWNVSSGR
jgi:hypothetical protein